MNFKGHLTGGMAAGALVVAIAATVAPEAALVTGKSAPPWLAALASPDQPLGRALTLFTLTVYMALFPDLDTRSTPQKWYLRGMFATLVALLLTGRHGAFVLTALLLPLPLLHKHRGWTHWKITPWLLVLALAALQEFTYARETFFYRFDPGAALERATEAWPLYLAMVSGHATHLLLDARAPRWFPFIRNGPKHH